MNIENKKARFDYTVLESIECGISLKGNEVKSIKNGMVTIKDTWISIENDELIIKNMNVTPWETTNTFDIDVKRDRRLLAHKHEIRRLKQVVSEKGLTLIPLKLYATNGKIKCCVGLCKGKKLYDKRESLKKADNMRDINRAMKGVM